VNGTATTSNNDCLAKTGTRSFHPGQTTEPITIAVKGDSKEEANETVPDVSCDFEWRPGSQAGDGDSCCVWARHRPEDSPLQAGISGAQRSDELMTMKIY
jgi:hypothetical protein